jgi:hypothetical protein
LPDIEFQPSSDEKLAESTRVLARSRR